MIGESPVRARPSLKTAIASPRGPPPLAFIARPVDAARRVVESIKSMSCPQTWPQRRLFALSVRADAQEKSSPPKTSTTCSSSTCSTSLAQVGLSLESSWRSHWTSCLNITLVTFGSARPNLSRTLLMSPSTTTYTTLRPSRVGLQGALSAYSTSPRQTGMS